MSQRVWAVSCQGAHNPKVVGSNPTPATPATIASGERPRFGGASQVRAPVRQRDRALQRHAAPSVPTGRSAPQGRLFELRAAVAFRRRHRARSPLQPGGPGRALECPGPDRGGRQPVPRAATRPAAVANRRTAPGCGCQRRVRSLVRLAEIRGARCGWETGRVEPGLPPAGSRWLSGRFRPRSVGRGWWASTDARHFAHLRTHLTEDGLDRRTGTRRDRSH